MRLVQVMVPTGKREAVLSVLDGEDIYYVVADETSNRDYAAIVTFPLPQAAVDPILDRLHEAGLDRDAYTVILDAETVVSARFEELVERYEESEENGEQIASEELTARAESLAPSWETFVVMTVVSAVVATAGLLLNSASVVVGSMVIAPLIGPAMATSVGSVVDDRDLLWRGVKLQVVGGVLAILSAAAFAALLREAHVVPLARADVFAIDEVRQRLVPDVLSLVIALGAGVAGALSLSTGFSATLVGVMIAVALVPPTAVVGIGLAWGSPAAVSGAFVLVLVNFLSINFAALAVLWYTGYRPRGWFRREEARLATLKRLAAIGGALLLLSALLMGVTYSTYRTATFEDRAHDTVVSELHDRGLELVSMEVRYENRFPFSRPDRVVLTVGHPPGTEVSGLAASLADPLNRIDDPALGGGGRVVVEVRYVAVERSADRTAPAAVDAAAPTALRRPANVVTAPTRRLI